MSDIAKCPLGEGQSHLQVGNTGLERYDCCFVFEWHTDPAGIYSFKRIIMILTLLDTHVQGILPAALYTVSHLVLTVLYYVHFTHKENEAPENCVSFSTIKQVKDGPTVQIQVCQAENSCSHHYISFIYSLMLQYMRYWLSIYWVSGIAFGARHT